MTGSARRAAAALLVLVAAACTPSGRAGRQAPAPRPPTSRPPDGVDVGGGPGQTFTPRPTPSRRDLGEVRVVLDPARPVSAWPVVARIRYGDARDQLSYRVDHEGRTVVTADLAAVADGVWVLDTVANRVVRWTTAGRVAEAVPLTEDGGLFVLPMPDGFVVADVEGRVRRYRAGRPGQPLELTDAPDATAAGLDGFGLRLGGRWQEFGPLGLPTGNTGVPGPGGPVDLVEVTGGGVEVGFGGDGGWHAIVTVHAPSGHGAFPHLAGAAVTAAGLHLFFDVDSERGQVDGRWLVELDPAGRLRGAERVAPDDAMETATGVGPDGRPWLLRQGQHEALLRRRG